MRPPGREEPPACVGMALAVPPPLEWLVTVCASRLREDPRLSPATSHLGPWRLMSAPQASFPSLQTHDVPPSDTEAGRVAWLMWVKDQGLAYR